MNGTWFLEISVQFLWHREVYGKKVKIGTSSGVVVKSPGFRNPWNCSGHYKENEIWLQIEKIFLILFHLEIEPPWDMFLSTNELLFSVKLNFLRLAYDSLSKELFIVLVS